MITIITGAPGTGKTAALVSLLSDLSKTRAIYVNGIPDLSIDHVNLEDATKWPEVVPDGSIVVIDEVQRVWRPRGPGSKVPPDIAALETHRHRGLDFYVITQSPRLIDSNVRGLAGRHVHLRDLGMLGRWWYEWPECADQCATTWKTAPLKKRYRLPKAIFGKYKSASEHIKPVRSVPWMVGVMVLALVVTAVLVWQAYRAISGRMSPGVVSTSPAAIKPLGAASAPTVQPNSVTVSSPYEFNQFVPRVASRPESAPAYDGLRVVSVMPVIVGGLCMGERCKCINQQGRDSGLSSDDCRDWLKSPPFDPYKMASVDSGHQSQNQPYQPIPENTSSPVQKAVSTL
jgi:zona occludens toxin